MYRAVCLVLLAAAPAFAAPQKWVEYRVGPFHVFSEAGNKTARDRLNEMEQLRHVLGDMLGKNGLGVGGPDQSSMDTTWPIDLLLYPNMNAFAPHAPKSPFIEGGSAMFAAWTADTPLPQDFLRALARMLIDTNSARMPDEIENGLCDLFSTLKAVGPKVTIGAQPDGLPPERLRGWAKVQLLATSPDYSGKFRVYLNNLQGIGDETMAARSAYGLTVEKLNQIVDDYLRAGKFATSDANGEPINPNRDFVEKIVGSDAIDQITAGIAADGKDFPPDSPRGLLAGRTRDVIEQAIQLNPKWAEPYFRLSDLEPNDDARIQDLKTAVKLEPRNTDYWQELAEAQTIAHKYTDAEKSWGEAIREASSSERDQIRKSRMQIEDRRAEWEVEERKRIAAEQAAELERVKKSAAAEVHAAEDAAAQKAGGLKPGEKPVQWWGEPEGQKVSGKLVRVDCLASGVTRLTIDIDGGGRIRLAIRDPHQLQVENADDAKFVCGVQRAPRAIRVIYNVKTDVKLDTVGDIAMVAFPQ